MEHSLTAVPADEQVPRLDHGALVKQTEEPARIPLVVVKVNAPYGMAGSGEPTAVAAASVLNSKNMTSRSPVTLPALLEGGKEGVEDASK